MELISRFMPHIKESHFLFGPRGTGKTTLIRERYPDALVIDLLDDETYRSYLARPERLKEAILARPGAAWVIVDEIQKAPVLLDTIHRIIEDKRSAPPRFILTGSSARKLRHAGVNLLGGRLLLRHLHPFMAAELSTRFDLERALRLGMLPLIWGSPEPEQRISSYIALYLKEEVQAEALVRNVGSFSRFLETMTFSHGSVLSLSQVARECQTGRKTVEGYVNILEDLLLGFRVDIFTRRAKRMLAGHPKFYYMDTGVFRSLRPRGPLDRTEEIGGACLEGLVAQHLLAWADYSPGEHRLSYWRTKAGNEVDFVLYGDKVFWAVEVKSGRVVSTADVRSLTAFREDYPESEVCLVYGGAERLRINGIPCLPAADFLLGLIPGQPFPSAKEA